MTYILVSLSLGLLLGVLFGKHPIQRLTSRGLPLLVLLLLFLMGLQLGQNSEVWESWSSVGITTLVITTCSILGSILTSSVYFRLIQPRQ